MQVVIDIPSAFIDHFHNDRFYDALMRLSSDAHLMAGRYEKETAEMLIKAFEKAVEIPTHGRLVDGDKLCKVLKARAADDWNQGTAPFSWSYAYDCMADIVDTLPTVIPEEET